MSDVKAAWRVAIILKNQLVIPFFHHKGLKTSIIATCINRKIIEKTEIFSFIFLYLSHVSMTNDGIGKSGALGLCHRNVTGLHIFYVAVTLEQAFFFFGKIQYSPLYLIFSNSIFIIVTRIFVEDKRTAYRWKADGTSSLTVCGTFFGSY